MMVKKGGKPAPKQTQMFPSFIHIFYSIIFLTENKTLTSYVFYIFNK